MLLHTLGISAKTLLEKQLEYLEFLRIASTGDVPAIFQFLSFINHFELGEKLLLEGYSEVQEDVDRMIHAEYLKLLTKRKEQKCRIMIPKSRLLFGVCEPTRKCNPFNRLKPGTCFVRITDHSNGRAYSLTNADVLVTRNPCLHPGDLQKFRTVNVPEFSHLVDCIVFPTCGERPTADLMSGGDLDGDKFIVIWDPDVIPRKLSQPAVYPAVREQRSFVPPSNDDRADHFARFNSKDVGVTKKLYLQWARLKGPMSQECQELNRLYSLALDGHSILVPARLSNVPESEVNSAPFILDMLHSAAKEVIEAAHTEDVQIIGCPVDAMDLVLNKDRIATSEFDLIQLTLRWCRLNEQNFWNYAVHFDFGTLTDSQRGWILAGSPPIEPGPALVNNGLLQSNLVRADELRRFGLDHHGLHWKRAFDSSSDSMRHFMGNTSHVLGLFHKKLILIRVDQRLVIAVLIPIKIAKATETHVSSNVRVLALPQSNGVDSLLYRARVTTSHYRLYCDEASFQLYDGKRQNTFIWLKQRQAEEFSLTSKKKISSSRTRYVIEDNSVASECMASIALDKLSQNIQRHVGRVNRTGILAAVSIPGTEIETTTCNLIFNAIRKHT